MSNNNNKYKHLRLIKYHHKVNATQCEFTCILVKKKKKPYSMNTPEYQTSVLVNPYQGEEFYSTQSF